MDLRHPATIPRDRSRQVMAGPIRVALLNGVYVRHDAISYSLRLKLDLLRSLRSAGHAVEVDAFVQGTDLDDPDVHVRSLIELVRDPVFAAADLFVYEFGINYDLFDSVFLLGEDKRCVGIYHNVTPPELIDWAPARAQVEHGLLLRHNLGLLDHVACDSEFNRGDLLECGLAGERLSVLALPPRVSQPRVDAPDWSVDPVEILFVSRLVRAKGVHDLLDAAALLRAEGESGFRVTLAGSALFSDDDVIESIRSAAGGSDQAWVRLITDPDDRTLESLYRASSVLALPSYHEGYCLPVLEAFHAGCQVVTSDAGNLPAIVGGLGQVVGTGDVQGLARALRQAVAASRASSGSKPFRIPTTNGDLEPTEWFDRVGDHLAKHSLQEYQRSFRAILCDLGVDLPADDLTRHAA
jgi:glycosyltransferase involved in cell wall biosynthesis